MTIQERAREIAEEANECCNRSDGWEEKIYKLALMHLDNAVGEALIRYQTDI